MNIEQLAREAHEKYDDFVTRGVCEPRWAAVLTILVRNAALEEAADICEEQDQEYEQYTGQPVALQYQCAAAIRSMKVET